MGVQVSWDTSAEQPPARRAAFASMTAVTAGEKEAWLDLFAPDAVVEDPVGPSFFDEEGKGHHGRDGISAFWDKTIGNVERFEFTIRDSHAAGDECANVGTITTYLPGGYRVDTDGVFVYRVGEDGLNTTKQTNKKTEHTMATARQVTAE